MASFLKKILEPSEEDAFDHLTWMEKPRLSIFEGLKPEDVLPSPNVGLPSALIPREPPGPAYVTHTGPLVRWLRQQDGPGRAAPEPHPHPHPAPHWYRPRSEPRPAPGPAPGPAPALKLPPPPPRHRRAPAPPALCHTIIFARRPAQDQLCQDTSHGHPLQKTNTGSALPGNLQ
ncbi:basic proline-rich protein-like [Zonotrichia leucophrys gambelii]|uniref:basic proline-rich protein-like n=1 Tax=Zonotrichia leucophrys gambelii TaxID=257770 RepID=UPI0031400878